MREQRKMNCKECGAEMYEGSGYFSTDFKCRECGAEYNSSGQRLAPRSQWGEETGEVF